MLRAERAWRAARCPIACTEHAFGVDTKAYYINTVTPALADALALEIFLGDLSFDEAERLWANESASRGGIKQTTCECSLAWPFFYTGPCPHCM